MENYGIQSTHESLKKRLIDYIKTAYFGKNDELRKICVERLEKEGVLWQEPYIEGNPAYKVIKNGLKESKEIPKDIKEILNILQDNKLGVFPNPYFHQVKAIEEFYKGKDLFIATGTGSGKTECFMWPIVTKLVNEAKTSPKVWENRGIRVIMMYPMNALVADQMGRLRKMIGDKDNKFLNAFNEYSENKRRPQFGMYTGRTPFAGDFDTAKCKELADTFRRDLLDRDEEIKDKLINLGKYPSKYNLEKFVNSLEDGKKDYYDENDAELITRFEMQNHTPDILITNYSMLEYMLMRKLEQPIWDDTKEWLDSSEDNKLLFIIDEAHMYKGASGGEVALLIRRFMQRLKISRDRIQFILTSASIPSEGEKDVLKFACDLTGEKIENQRFEIITGEKESISYENSLKCSAVELAKFDINSLYIEEDKKLSSIKNFGEIAGLDVSKCSFSNKEDVEVWLYEELSKFEPLLKIMEKTRGDATSLKNLVKEVFPNDEFETAEKAVSNILAIAPLAKNKDGRVLYPTRLHLMFRGLQGLYACSNPNCSKKTHNSTLPIGEIYFGAHDDICECGGKIYELINDRTCGALFYRGYINKNEENSDKKYLWNKRGMLDKDSFKEIHYYIPLNNESVKCDEKKGIKSVYMNSLSGRLETNENNADKDYYVRLIYSDNQSDEDANLNTFKNCPKCKRQKLKLTDFSTKGNESFFNLISEQLAVQPQNIFDEDELEYNPNAGRKVLLFSDSRQKAAKLAKELTSIADEEALRKAIVVSANMLLEVAKESDIEPTMDLLYRVFLKVAYENNLKFFFGNDEEKINEDINGIKKEIDRRNKRGKKIRFDRLRGYETVPELYSKYLLKHLCNNFKSLTDLGLCWIEPCEEKLYDVIDDLEDENIEIDEEDLKRIFCAWVNDILKTHYAYDPSVRYEVRRNITNYPDVGIPQNDKFKVYIKKILKNKFNEDEINIIYDLFIKEFTSSNNDGSGERFLNPSCIVLKYDKDKEWYKCPRCGRIFPFTLFGKCALCGEGEPKIMGKSEFDGLSFWREPVIASVNGEKNSLMTRINTEEHTAQLSHKDQRNNLWSTTEEYEIRFQNVRIDGKGPVDVLSCTTTMEVGIDIGSLTAVGLRNIPPMRENYQQRAGRAGRRSSAISTIVTYTDDGPHDNYYFNNPEYIISGEPSTPGIDIDNARLLYRHLNVVYLTEFLLSKEKDASKLGIIDFVKNDLDLFSEFVTNYSFNDKRLSILVPNSKKEIVDSLKESLIKELSELKIKVEKFESRYFEGNKERKRQKKTLDVLLEEGILPTYSFPRNVVGFNIEDVSGKNLEQEPDRSLDLAISEYAPGRVLVVNKKTYKSGGIYSFHSKFNEDKNYLNRPAAPYFESKDYFKGIYYCNNSSCNWVSFESPNDNKCPFCGAEAIGKQNLLKPWGFAPLDGKNIGDAVADIEKSYAEEPSYSVPIEDKNMNKYGKYKKLRFAKLENQPLLILNKGPKGEGFSVCKNCGAAVPGDKEEKLYGVKKPFKPLNKGSKECNHDIVNTFLGHKFLTDMILFEIKLDKRKIDTSTDSLWVKSAALTLSEAMALGASQLLDIDFNDLKSGYRIRYTDGDYTYVDIYLFDSLSSGAGYSSMLENKIDKLFDETKKVLECKNNCKTACHDCLKHYHNQRVQDDLDRHLAKQLLNWCIDETLPKELDLNIQKELIKGLKECVVVDKEFEIGDKENKITVTKDSKTKEIVVYPVMHNPQIYAKSSIIPISDRMLIKALPNAYSKILENM